MRRPFAAVLAVAGLVLSACTGSGAGAVASSHPAQPGASVAPTPALARFYQQEPAWHDCNDGFQCTSILVPLDYADPGRASITLNLIRLPATDPAHRIGSLLINPGGPGVSGIDYARHATEAFSARLRAVYDIVGFDPRGVGSSTPVRCISDRQTDALLAYDASPDNAAEEQGLLALNRQLADGCATNSPTILPLMGTVDAARDMDVIRAVVGDATLHYFGASYGTFLGATYAEEFPHKVGRMVLDGAIDPTLTPARLAEGQLVGFDRALGSFLADCVQRSDCPVGPTVADARAQIAELVASADQHPLPSQSGRPVTQSLVILGLITPLYTKANWPLLRAALAEARDGNGDQLLWLADLYADRNADGTYNSNQNVATVAINCLDRADHSTLPQLRAQSARFAQESPIFGPFLAWGDLPCTVWPAPPTDRPHQIHAKGAAPILVVGTTRDPATPYPWARNLAAQLDSGRLLTRVGDGHTAYMRGSACIDDAVDRYLITGQLPPVGTVCTT